MMQEIAPSIWQVRGAQPGRTLTVIGGTHGNERTGVEVVSTLKGMIDAGELEIVCGTLTLVHGNPRAIELNQRGSEPHADLNRAFFVDLLERVPLGIYEDVRAREIAPFLSDSDIVVDLHATNKPSEPFIVSMYSPRHEAVYRWFSAQKVLADPRNVLAGKPVTTDEYTDAHGGIGVGYETGQAADLARVDEVAHNVIELLIDRGLVEGHVEPPVATREIYEMTEAIILTDVGFTFASGFGEGSWEAFRAKETLGSHGDTPLVARYDGVIVFPKVQEHRRVGSPVAYLARRTA